MVGVETNRSEREDKDRREQSIVGKFIYAVHDRGGAHILKGKGWVVVSEAIGDGANDWSTASYRELADQGLGVIVRLNFGYNPKGTIPVVERYPHFAARCGNFVEKSDGCHIWIIGNETNLAAERPGGKDGQVISPTMYAICYRQCRREIRSRQGHENDQVLVAAVGPWNAETKGWIEYFRDVLWELNVDRVHGFQLEGIALHTYSRGADPASVTAETMMGAPFEHRRSSFRSYVDFMEAIPAWARSLPVYITEANQNAPWQNRDTGWVQAAYAEINRWNKGLGHQQIRCLALYRWAKYDRWFMDGKSGVLDDLKLAQGYGYKWGAHPEPVVPHPDPLPNDETATDLVTLAQKVRWWLEELIRQIEKGEAERVRAIGYSLVKLMYRLEEATRA